jgi:hypothetical protein
VSTTILLLVCAPYAAAAVGYLEARRRDERPPTWARALGGATVLLHLLALILLGRETGRSPFHTEAEALSFLAFALAALYVVLEATSGVAAYGGGFYLLTAILAAGGVPGLARAAAAVPSPRAGDSTLSLHVGFALLGTAAIAAGGLLATGYLGVYRKVKSRRLAMDAAGGPSLFGLQRLARDASFSGLLLLGPSLVLGWMVLGAASGRRFWAHLEIALAALQFLLVAAAAFLWWRRPLRGAVAAWLNVAATVVAVVALALVHPLLVASEAGSR